MRFSDGTALDAEAVRVNWDMHARPETGSLHRGAAAGLRLEVVDPLTLRVTPPARNVLLDRTITTELTYIAAPSVLRSGGAHLFVAADPPTLDKAEKELNVAAVPSGGGQSLAFNLTRAPLDDARARRAIALALDPRELADTLGAGYRRRNPRRRTAPSRSCRDRSLLRGAKADCLTGRDKIICLCQSRHQVMVWLWFLS